MLINRSFDHKTFGHIGDAQLEAEAVITLNGTVLPEASIMALLNHSLQYLQDAYAGSDTLAEAQGSFGKKLANLLAGTIGVRGPRAATLSMKDDILLSVVKRFMGKQWTVPKGTKPIDFARAAYDSFPPKRQALVDAEVERQVAFYESDDIEV